jgi:hypothetical protein
LKLRLRRVDAATSLTAMHDSTFDHVSAGVSDYQLFLYEKFKNKAGFP